MIRYSIKFIESMEEEQFYQTAQKFMYNFSFKFCEIVKYCFDKKR